MHFVLSLVKLNVGREHLLCIMQGDYFVILILVGFKTAAPPKTIQQILFFLLQLKTKQKQKQFNC